MSEMTYEQNAPLPAGAVPQCPDRIAGLEGELLGHRVTEMRLRAALAREELLITQKDEMIARQALLSQESDHRMLNDLQMIVSLLSLQSRKATNPEAAAQLATAAHRVAMIERVHRRLHCLDSTQTVAFGNYLQDFSADFTSILDAREGTEHRLKVHAVEADLPAATAIPLGFIVNELLTNAAKYGHGDIEIRLERAPTKGYALSVTNDGPALPDGFDPAASKGLGMRIVRAFVGQIGGDMQFSRADGGQGARFTVIF